MRKNTLHIALLLVLGLYYNGAAVVWVAYSTFAKDFFIERCENPAKPCCQGQCHVKQIEDHSGASTSNSTSARLQVADPQPTIPTAFSLCNLCPRPEIRATSHDARPLDLVLDSPLRPPRA